MISIPSRLAAWVQITGTRLADTLRRQWLRILLGSACGAVFAIVSGAAIFAAFDDGEWIPYAAAAYAYSCIALGGVLAYRLAGKEAHAE